MSHILFVYDRPESQAALPEGAREAVYREYEALAAVPDMVGYRLQPSTPGNTLTVTDEGRQTRLEPAPIGGLQIIGFYILATDDPGRAAQLAARVPAARIGGAIEIHRLAGQ